MAIAPAWRVFQERGMVQRGDNWDAVCPAHKDVRKSLSLQLTPDGRVLLRCFAGCPAVTVVELLGLKMMDLWPPEENKPKREERPFNVVAEYIYRDEQGNELYKVQRSDPKGFRQLRRVGDRWDFKLGDVRRVLYRLPELLSSTRPVLFVEGEKDVATAEGLGFVATTCNGGAGGFRPEMAEHLRGREVIILPDNDTPGIELAWIIKSHVPRAMIVKIPLDKPKADLSDWVAAGATARDVRELCKRQALENVLYATEMAQAIGALKK